MISYSGANLQKYNESTFIHTNKMLFTLIYREFRVFL